ncbi:hypothetical protein RchiOBHm_Chr2g0135451 [Rosa chinensis]|uniref:Uncharacterized protein n=1 Tax=Rosa chinensis TaxID=74649 RepID=A0A2P6RW28_ROSCH|nr:hypothetical protein RchiOBHm_Chr2g0135451 [Rosa chinensis]
MRWLKNRSIMFESRQLFAIIFQLCLVMNSQFHILSMCYYNRFICFYFLDQSELVFN